MYTYQLPHTISNPFGEELTFLKKEEMNGEERIWIRNRLQPGAGPPFHVHFKQDEFLEVQEGRMAIQIKGEPERILMEGESMFFKRGEIHRFRNVGEEVLICEGWISPANSIDYFLSGVYRSMSKAGKPQGDTWDSAYLLTRYRSEYDIDEIPAFVKRFVMPVTVFIGKLSGRYAHFRDAPKPLK